MKNLPLGTQSFEKMRDTKSNFLYVDKTERIFDLVSSGSVFFLSRPRRFGKSLLASTLRALFEGRKEWFEGLYIYDKWDWSRKYPVINISFGSRSVGSAEILRNTLSSLMLGIAADNGIVLTEQYHTERFAQLIRELHREKKEKVVILIDEYDKAIRNNLNKSVEVQTAIREVLRDFYEVIKDLDEHIHFVFITGVTKFAGVSIFSGLNNLFDITLAPKFCDICGYTQKELQTYFKEHIDNLAQKYSYTKEKILEIIKLWYNGYTWDGKTSIYNPYSTLNLFSKNIFSNYWFASATSGFLLDLVEKDYNYRELVFDEINVSENLLTCANLKKLLPISILFQTGYLTISAIQTEPNKLAQTYTLVWPNEEVKCSFSQEILESMTGSDNLILLIEKFKKPIIKSFETLNAQDFQEYFPLIYACIPYNALEARESNYQAIFILAMRLMGFDISGEDRTSWGSADAVIRQQKQTIIVEIKYAKKSENVNKKVDAALKQIKDKKYWQKHISPNKKIILLGLVFANKGKVVKGKFEEMK